jgi:hypothetical protein
MSNEVEVIKVAVVHLLSTDQEAEYNSFFEDADYIIAQLVNDNYFCEFVRTNYLKKKYKNKVISILNLFYRARHPDFIYLRDRENNKISGPLGDYHIETVYNAWCANDSKSELLNTFDENYRSRYQDTIRMSRNELLERQKKVDVKIFDFIDENQNNELFHSFNHPSNLLLIEFAKRILLQCGFKVHDMNESPTKEFLLYPKLPSLIYGEFTNISYREIIFQENGFALDKTKFLVGGLSDLVDSYFMLYDFVYKAR